MLSQRDVPLYIFQEPNIINRCTNCFGNMMGNGRGHNSVRLVSGRTSEKPSMELGLEV